jgi:sulfide:quinone oxidoreductase
MDIETPPTTATATRVLIAGGGVAAIEAALALKQTAGALVRISMLAPNDTFTYRPELVGEPFSYPAARHYQLARITADLDITLHADSLKWVDTEKRLVHTGGYKQIGYDVLLLALGATTYPAMRHALTLVPERLDEQMRGVIQDLEGGMLKQIVFVIPERTSWPLPMYELALMAAARSDQMNLSPSITLVTPEDAPLAIFGKEASQAVQQLLDERGIKTITSASGTIRRAGRLTIHPSEREIRADLVVTLPELFAPSMPGLGPGAGHGFLTTDREGRVLGREHIFAAGDLTSSHVKHGSIAAQQADSAAAAIAILAGAQIDPEPIVPMLSAVLWDGERPLYMRARVTGSHGSESEVSTEPLWDSPGKIQARHLGPYLESLDLAAAAPSTPRTYSPTPA